MIVGSFATIYCHQRADDHGRQGVRWRRGVAVL
jgi:hypothetical protein